MSGTGSTTSTGTSPGTPAGTPDTTSIGGSTTTSATAAPADPAAGDQVRPLDPRLLRHARAARAYVALTAGLGVATAVVVVAQAVLLARVVAGVAMDGESLQDAAPHLLALLAVVVVRGVLATTGERFGHRAAVTVVAQLRGAVLGHLAELTRSGRAGQGPGGDGPALATLVTRGLDALDTYLTRYLPQLLLVATVTPGVLAVIAWHDPISGALVGLTLPLVPLFMALVGWTTASSARRRLTVMQRLGAQVLDLVAGLPTLRALGRDRGQVTRVREVGDAYRRATMRTLRSAFLSALVLESLTTLSVALVAVGIGLRLVFGELDLRTGLTVLILAPEVYLPLRMVGVHYHASVDGLAAAGQAFAVLASPAPVSPASQAATGRSGRRPAPDLRRAAVRLRGVSVVHPDRAVTAPYRLDLELRPGEVVALVGASGAGKTTAVQVLLGLRRPDAGAVLVNGVDLADVDPATWHAQIAWVPQRPSLVPGTLAENAWFGAAPGAGAPTGPVRQRLDAAAAVTGLDEVVAGLPQGWRTRIGHGGHGLSAGQRQRLALCRALLREAAVVVLDEPTAHLDAATELRVHEAIAGWRRSGTTVLLVAHRPALAGLADRQVRVRAEAGP